MAYRIPYSFSGERPGRRTPCITDDQFIQRSFATMLERSRVRCGLQADSHFLRDNHGAEVDLLFEYFGKLHAVKIESGATFTPDWLHGSPAVAALRRSGRRRAGGRVRGMRQLPRQWRACHGGAQAGRLKPCAVSLTLGQCD